MHITCCDLVEVPHMESSLVAVSKYWLSIRAEQTTKEAEITSTNFTHSYLQQHNWRVTTGGWLIELTFCIPFNTKTGHFGDVLLSQSRSIPHHHHNHFTALFPGPSGWAGAKTELLDFMVKGKINRGRHTDHPAGRHSILTNQCPLPPSPPYFLQAGCPSCHPANSV